jgi:hypothetical protein
LIISNQNNAYIHKRAETLKIPSFTFTKEQFFDAKPVLELLTEYNIDAIVLAGFLLKIPTLLIQHFPDKIINIHPALLPKFGGKGMYGARVHQAVKEAGKTLYDRAGSLLTMADITKREVIKASQAATIHIGFTPSTVSMMSDYLIRFSTSHPDIRFDIHEGSTFTLREQLENGVVDITTLRTPIVLKGCESRTLMQEKLLAMAAAGNPVLEKNKDGITLEELSEQKLILSHRYRSYLLSAFEKKGLLCDIYCECEDARTAMTLAE